ncbi:prothoracicotropic hormone [Anabrus simplex]|uniref:prothoracicotropic hormone n=1 Tax=Anabrus simplex TaxID=316456 RepID=UPI0035A3ABE3
MKIASGVLWGQVALLLAVMRALEAGGTKLCCEKHNLPCLFSGGVLCQEWNTMIKRQPVAVSSESIPLTSCSCDTAEYTMMNLGPQYFPHELQYLLCEPLPCWKPPYRCKKRIYEVAVMRNRTESESLNDNLPIALRNQWTFEKMSVVVGCECSL